MVLSDNAQNFLELHATFEVIVLRRQEELCGPSQHCIIRISMSHNSSDDPRASEQREIQNEHPFSKMSQSIICSVLAGDHSVSGQRGIRLELE